MNITLIFPPYVSLTCVPIGIASLKAYLEKTQPSARIALCDFNISYIHSILGGRFSNLHRICRKSRSHCARQDDCPLRGPLLQKHRDMFLLAQKVIRKRALFFEEDTFTRCVPDTINYLSAVNGCVQTLLKQYVEGRLSHVEMIEDLFAPELKNIASTRPDLVGFSLLIDSQIHCALALARLVKDNLGIPIVLGGPALFHFDLTGLLAQFPYVDFIVVKEGELAMAGLVKALQSGGFQSVPNLVWRSKSGIQFNKREFIADLDSVPAPDFDGLDLDAYLSPERILPLATSRHCPWGKCKFCALNAQYDGRFRVRSIARVVEDIKHLTNKYGVRNYFLTDSSMPPQRLKKFSMALSEAKADITFGCYMRPEREATSSVLNAFRDAGGKLLVIGAESLSNRSLRILNKGTSFESARELLKRAHQLGITTLVYMMAGFPSQTRKELREDCKRIAGLQKEYGIFIVAYASYQLGIHQKFFEERDQHHIQVGSPQPYYTLVNGGQVRKYDGLPYTYAQKPARELLRSIQTTGPESQLLLHAMEFGINGDNRTFRKCINNCFFETQLLYPGGRSESTTAVR